MYEIENYNRVNVFSKMKSNIKNEEPKMVQNTIKKYRNNIKKTFEQEPDFIDIMDIIDKQARSNNVYQNLIKNGIKYNSQLIRLIYKTTQRLADINKIKSILSDINFNRTLYNFPSIDKMKTKKEKYENLNIKKIKMVKLNNKKIEDFKAIDRKKLPFKTIDEIFKQRNMKKIILSSSSTKNTKNSINLSFGQERILNPNKRNNISFNSKDLSITPSGTRINTESLKDTSINYKRKRESKSSISFLKEKNNNSFINNFSKKMDIIEKCEQEEQKGYYINKSVNKYRIYFDKLMQGRLNKEEILDVDHKVIQENQTIKNKYSNLEEEKEMNIKKTLKEKMSENFVYENRKELIELMKLSDIKAYNFRLSEVKSTNKKLFEKYKLDRKKIDKVIFKARRKVKKFIFVNEKIDELIKKNRKLKKKINYSMDLTKKQKHLIVDGIKPKEDLILSYKQSLKDD